MHSVEKQIKCTKFNLERNDKIINSYKQDSQFYDLKTFKICMDLNTESLPNYNWKYDLQIFLKLQDTIFIKQFKKSL